MVAQVSTPTPRTIRVYCPSHKVGFSAAATATIECSSATHTLAHDFPSESFWEYCCDCQHYWPIDGAKGNKGTDDCPVCERYIDRRALCSDCKVISVESNEAAKRKAFSISSQGLVGPACPGCLRQFNRAVLEHSCADFGLSQHETFVPSVTSDSSRRRVFLVQSALTSRSYRAQRFWFVSNLRRACSLKRRRVNTF
jgi:hypothetical protein